MVEAISRPQTVSISVTDLVRARVSSGPVTIPVNGGVYARLPNVTAVPSGEGAGSVSYARMRVLDSMIGRMRAEQEASAKSSEQSELERRQLLLEEVARTIATMKNPVGGLVFDALV